MSFTTCRHHAGASQQPLVPPVCRSFSLINITIFCHVVPLGAPDAIPYFVMHFGFVSGVSTLALFGGVLSAARQEKGRIRAWHAVYHSCYVLEILWNGSLVADKLVIDIIKVVVDDPAVVYSFALLVVIAMLYYFFSTLDHFFAHATKFAAGNQNRPGLLFAYGCCRSSHSHWQVYAISYFKMCPQRLESLELLKYDESEYSV
ncbi:hypothetical protein J3R82DRAFT_287 [Butyriboletus roseoflavus]|nr:hypothetical protein J3R82DRAFT_287 [Butyriboletus roseoflavus]